MAQQDADESTWCVYLPEFTGVHVSTARGHAGQVECHQKFTELYLGRVRPGSWRIVQDGRAEPPRYSLEIRLPVLKAEVRGEDAARARAARLGREAVAVPWGSEEEQQLLDYGSRRLKRAPAAT